MVKVRWICTTNAHANFKSALMHTYHYQINSWVPIPSARSTSRAKGEDNFFILLTGVIAWVSGPLFQICQACSYSTWKVGRWAVISQICPNHRRQSEGITSMRKRMYRAKTRQRSSSLFNPCSHQTPAILWRHRWSHRDSCQASSKWRSEVTKL